jgi:Uma2 family endonuclease
VPKTVPDSYRRLQPALVVEVVTRGSIDKDYRRNRGLYQKVRQVREYWIVDPTRSARKPSMTVHHRARGASAFSRLDVAAGGTYESRTWSGLTVELSQLLNR